MKKRQKLTKGAWTLIIVFTVLFLLDLITTLMNGEIIHFLETNPLYLLTGSFVPIIAYNVICVLVLAYFYMKRGTDFKFFIWNLFSWLSLARLAAIRNAISIYLDPPTIAQAMTLTTATKATIYVNTMLVLVFIPLIVTQVAYYFFKIDHKIIQK